MDQAKLYGEGTMLRVDVSPELLRELTGALRPIRGIVHSFVLKGLSFEVEPSTIRDPSGNVVEIVG
jgi:hypothetical protein